MPLKFTHNLSNNTNPSTVSFDRTRRDQRNKKNLSIKIGKLYGSGAAAPLIPSTAFWQFNDSPGASISDLIVTFTGNVGINWGDDTAETLTSGQTTQHTY